jgi:hypothetical protein
MNYGNNAASKRPLVDQSNFSLGNHSTTLDRSNLLNKAKVDVLMTFVDQIFLEKEIESIKKEF